MSVVTATRKKNRQHITRDKPMGTHLAMISDMRQRNMQLAHVKAHADEKDSYMWSQQTWGNFIADNAAAGRLDHRLMPSNIIYENYQMLDSEKWFRANTPYYITHNSGLHISRSIMSLVSEKRIQRYLNNRATISNNADRSRWVNTTVKLAAKAATSLPHKYMNFRLRYDKSYHGGNQRRDGQEGLCPLCNLPDSLNHIAQHCHNPHSDRIRYAYQKRIEDTIDDFDDDERPFLNKLNDIAVTSPEQGWTGMYSATSVDSVQELAAAFDPSQVRFLKKALKSIVADRQQALGHMWKARNRQAREIGLDPPRRTNISPRRRSGNKTRVVTHGYLPRDGIG
jgi:hypothetical protein